MFSDCFHVPDVVLHITLCPMPCYIRDVVEDRFRACFSPMQFVCLSFSCPSWSWCASQFDSYSRWHCVVLETSRWCDLQQVFQGSSLGSSSFSATRNLFVSSGTPISLLWLTVLRQALAAHVVSICPFSRWIGAVITCTTASEAQFCGEEPPSWASPSLENIVKSWSRSQRFSET